MMCGIKIENSGMWQSWANEQTYTPYTHTHTPTHTHMKVRIRKTLTSSTPETALTWGNWQNRTNRLGRFSIYEATDYAKPFLVHDTSQHVTLERCRWFCCCHVISFFLFFLLFLRCCQGVIADNDEWLCGWIAVEWTYVCCTTNSATTALLAETWDVWRDGWKEG